MKLRSPIDAVAFIDGRVDFYRRSESGGIDENTCVSFYFAEQGYSYKRFAEARMEQQEFERIIRIPWSYRAAEVTEGTVAVIHGKKYVVLSCTKVLQTSPVSCSVVLGNWDNAIVGAVL